MKRLETKSINCSRDLSSEQEKYTTMWSSLLLTLAAVCGSILVPEARAISLEKCSYRVTNMQHTDDTYRIAVFDCDFNEDLYLKSRLDDNLAPISSVASLDEVAASIATSGIISSVPWANFAGLSIAHEMAVPNSLFSYNNNVKLTCHTGEIDFELFQKVSMNKFSILHSVMQIYTQCCHI